MELLQGIPAIIRMLIVFAIILISIRKKMSLGNAFILGAFIMGLMFGQTPLAFLKSAFFSLIHPKTLSLSVVVCLILVLSHSMEKAGQMGRLLDQFQGRIRHPGANLIIFPALIGLLPMPGGAIFSAPMVKHIGGKRGFTSEQLSYTNYWFRHIWEYWWPLYPGVLLTTAMTGLDVWVFVLFQIPLTFVAFFSGYWPVRKQMNSRDGEGLPADPLPLGGFIRELAPILISIVGGLGFGAAFSGVFKPPILSISKELGLILALTAAIGWVWQTNRFTLKDRLAVLGKQELLRMFYMVAAILIFKGILEDSRAVDAVSQELISLHVSMMLIAIILPMLVGIVSGITIAFVGTTFPILITLLNTLGQGHLILPYMMLGMTSGFVGVLFSPLHLCLLLSNEYFETTLEPVYRHMWVPCGALLASSCVYFLIARNMIG
jgi:hypothetical protein